MDDLIREMQDAAKLVDDREAARAEAMLALNRAMARAHEAGASWGEIAAVVGVSASAAMTRARPHRTRFTAGGAAPLHNPRPKGARTVPRPRQTAPGEAQPRPGGMVPPSSAQNAGKGAPGGADGNQ